MPGNMTIKMQKNVRCNIKTFNIRAWRKRLGYSELTVHHQLGITIEEYQSYENSNKVPKNILLSCFALELGNLLFIKSIAQNKDFNPLAQSYIHAKVNFLNRLFYDRVVPFDVSLIKNEKIYLDNTSS